MKTVYMSFLLHGNMCYDRYTKQEIRDKFPRIYGAGVRALHKFPDATAHIDLPGLTLLSLRRYAPWLMDEMRPLVERGQVMMLGCQYAASHALCSDEESDAVACRVSMRLMRDLIQPDVSSFFPQEIAFHPQVPWILNQAGARRLVIAPKGWKRPRRVAGLEGSELNVYPFDPQSCRREALEQFYDACEDGDFVMTGGDFEMLGRVDLFVEEIARLAEKGKLIKWTTIERYEREVGVRGPTIPAPPPIGYVAEDQPASPSFSRWVADPEDMRWHEQAVAATAALRAAGFAEFAAAQHHLGPVNVPLEQAWTQLPDNVWDHWFEEVLEYPETEPGYLSASGAPTILARAWHHLLIGLNSDSSGWFPWSPRTRHRTVSLGAAAALANEALARFATRLAARLTKPQGVVSGYALALNPMAARTVEVALPLDAPLAFAKADGVALPGQTVMENGRWQARARVELPSHGYRLLRLVAAPPGRPPEWRAGDRVARGAMGAELDGGVLALRDGARRLDVAVAPFKLSDPSGVAPAETVTPTWTGAKTRVRDTAFGPDFEVTVELAWAVWLRLVLGLREDRIAVTAEVHFDLPRRIGNLRYDPAGLLLEFKGAPGEVWYDIPYATIRHPYSEPAFVAVQRFAAIDGGDAERAFGIVALGGNQSFRVCGRDGLVAVNLGASTQGRADTRPECNLRPDGTSEHKIVSGGDPFMGVYCHTLAAVFARRTELPLLARRYRIPAPVFAVEPGNGGWPAAQSLLPVAPEAAYLTAFRTGTTAGELVVNNLADGPLRADCAGQALELPRHGVGVVKTSPWQ